MNFRNGAAIILAFAAAVLLFRCGDLHVARSDTPMRQAGKPLQMDCQPVGGNDLERCENQEVVCYVWRDSTYHGGGSIQCGGKGRRFSFHDEPDND